MAASVTWICRLGKDAAMAVCMKRSSYIVQQVCRREFSSKVTSQVVTTKVDGFQLSSVNSAHNLHPRPLVVLIGWLNAKGKHLLKYQELYWDKGFDVLTMDVTPVHIVRPRAGIEYTKKLLKTLQENQVLCQRQVVFHGFSIGAFIYTQLQLLLQLQEEPGSSPRRRPDANGPDLSERIAGLVLDSPAYMNHMCEGIAKSVSSNPALRALIVGSLQLYLASFARSVTFHYRESERVFHHNVIPTLILYSRQDPISAASTSEMYVQEWRSKGRPAFTSHFPDSQHVSHFRLYPREYVRSLYSFLDRLALTPPSVEVEEETVQALPEEVLNALQRKENIKEPLIQQRVFSSIQNPTYFFQSDNPTGNKPT